tara:strand:+ start:13110 stop:14816 length:1707 start_codon:yes stop_codon:yes gene_type:complete
MAKLLKLRRGSTSQHGSFTGAEGEVTVDTDKDTLVVHDGSTQGGFPVLRAEGGAQNISTTGTITSNDITIQDSQPRLNFNDNSGSPHDPDYLLQVDTGIFRIFDSSNNANRLVINADGHLDIDGNTDFGAGIDVTGAITTTGNITTTGQINIESASPRLHLNDTNSEDDFSVYNLNGVFTVYNEDDNRADITVASDGQIDFEGNVDCNSGLDVTGNITVTGTVDGVDVATRDTLFGSLTSSAGVLSNGVTATTQSAGDSSTKVATTAYTDTAISNLVDSSPSTLNTLNELAAALGDDANFSTTVTNSIATKMPLSGGTFTGAVIVGSGGTSVSDAALVVSADDAGAAIMLQRSGSGRFDCSVANEGGSLVFRTGSDSSTVAGLTNRLSINGNTGTVTAAGTMVATTFSGSGASLTNIPAANITGTLPAIDGSNLTGIVSFISGMIIMYNSATAPSGWYLCDGNNGTPDLRDRFIVGAGNSYSLNATGGSNTATDTVSISGSDTVSISGTTSATTGTKTFGFASDANFVPINTHTHTFSGSDTVNISGSDTVSVDTRSPYYALTFIMKA